VVYGAATHPVIRRGRPGLSNSPAKGKGWGWLAEPTSENPKKPPCLEGWVENGPAAALRLAFSPLRVRGFALASPCRQPVLNPTNARQKCMTPSIDLTRSGCKFAKKILGDLTHV